MDRAGSDVESGKMGGLNIKYFSTEYENYYLFSSGSSGIHELMVSSTVLLTKCLIIVDVI